MFIEWMHNLWLRLKVAIKRRQLDRELQKPNQEVSTRNHSQCRVSDLRASCLVS